LILEPAIYYIRKAVSLTRKAVVADRHNPIAVITLSHTLFDVRRNRCLMCPMFDLIDVLSSVRLVNEDNYEYKRYPEEAQNTYKGGRSGDFLNEVVD